VNKNEAWPAFVLFCSWRIKKLTYQLRPDQKKVTDPEVIIVIPKWRLPFALACCLCHCLTGGTPFFSRWGRSGRNVVVEKGDGDPEQRKMPCLSSISVLSSIKSYYSLHKRISLPEKSNSFKSEEQWSNEAYKLFWQMMFLSDRLKSSKTVKMFRSINLKWKLVCCKSIQNVSYVFWKVM